MRQALTQVYVHTDAFGLPPRLVGRATIIGDDTHKPVPGHFEYAGAYQSDPGVSLDPGQLPISLKEHHVQSISGLPGAIEDASPDDWGRRVMAEMKHPPQNMVETLLAARGTGIGALLFSQSRDAVKPRDQLLPFDELEEAMDSANRLETHKPLSENALRALALGMTLGGARPKTSVEWDGHPWIAKFPSNNDAVNQPRIEHASLRMAEAAGINVPQTEIVTLGGQDVLMVRRFDCQDGARLPFLSLQAALVRNGRASERDTAKDLSYPGMARWLARFGLNYANDGVELFRRACFNLCLGHVDDHTKNHAFLQTEHHDQGWHLAPAYDIAPSNGHGLALKKTPQVQSIGLGVEGRERSVDNLFSRLSDFGLRQDDGEDIFNTVREVVASWRSHFAAYGVSERDMNLMAGRILVPGQCDPIEKPSISLSM